MSNDKSYEEEVVPMIRVYISFAKKNNDQLDLDGILSFLSSGDGPASHIKEMIDKGMINIYACCFDKTVKVL